MRKSQTINLNFMRLIIGLGNPGEKYEKTRHNLGFVFLEKLREKWSFPDFKFEKKFNAEISQGEFKNEKVILAKPQTFMNLSGEATKKIMAFYKLETKNLIVIHDDIDILCGKYKLSESSSSAGHNGVQNIIDELGTKEFRRVRIGIKNETEAPEKETGDFVLGELTQFEMKKLEETEKTILEEIEKNIS